MKTALVGLFGGLGLLVVFAVPGRFGVRVSSGGHVEVGRPRVEKGCPTPREESAFDGYGHATYCAELVDPPCNLPPATTPLCSSASGSLASLAGRGDGSRFMFDQ